MLHEGSYIYFWMLKFRKNMMRRNLYNPIFLLNNYDRSKWSWCTFSFAYNNGMNTSINIFLNQSYIYRQTIKIFLLCTFKKECNYHYLYLNVQSLNAWSELQYNGLMYKQYHILSPLYLTSWMSTKYSKCFISILLYVHKFWAAILWKYNIFTENKDIKN